MNPFISLDQPKRVNRISNGTEGNILLAAFL